jgi:excisionase family DNA binding protein
MSIKRFYTIQEVSEYLGIEVSTLYAWVHTRQIPYYKIGRLVKFKVEEIEQWVNQRKVEVVSYE